MSVTAYIGLPGSGKSYEVVRSVILPALAQGRRIVTNIYGIHDSLCRDFIVRNSSSYKIADGLGDIVHVTNEQVNEPLFFPDYDDSDKFCKKGDLILLDEVHRFFGTRLSKAQENFIAEHRHYADALSGQTCDCVIVTQSLSTLPRFLRDRIDSTFRMKKLNHVGLNKRYRIDIFSTGRLVKANLIRSLQEKYNPQIFTLYDSNTVKNARETEPDNRANMLRSKKFIIGAVSFPVLMFFIVMRLIAFFHPSFPDKSVSPSVVPAPAQITSQSSQHLSPSSSSGMSSFDWCITGTLYHKGHNFVVLTDSLHHLRLLPRQFFNGEGSQISGEYEGQKLNSWSCQVVQSVPSSAPVSSALSTLTGKNE